MKRTFKDAQDSFFQNLGLLGWSRSSPFLKVRWAEKGPVRVWFKSRSVYIGSSGPGARLSDARSMTHDADLRDMPMGQFLDMIARWS